METEELGLRIVEAWLLAKGWECKRHPERTGPISLSATENQAQFLGARRKLLPRIR